MLVGGVVVILYLTLFPFSFTLAGKTVAKLIALRFSLQFPVRGATLDYLLNVLLFMPLGFGLGGVLLGRGWGRLASLLWTMVGSAVLSATVELIQVFLPPRDPSLSDIIANTNGGVFGFFYFLLVAPLTLRIADAVVANRRGTLSVAKLSIAAMVYLALGLFASVHWQRTASLSDWDLSFPLLIGNEATANRPWQGSVSHLLLADRLFSDEEVAHVLANPSPPVSARESVIGFYPLTDAESQRDHTGQLPDLTWQKPNPAGAGGAPLVVPPDNWLQSAAAGRVIAARIARTSQFTISAVMATASSTQRGPARVVSLSQTPWTRDFTIGQEQSDLILRLRTPLTGNNGAPPELSVTGLFADTRPHHVVIGYDGASLHFWVDKPESYFRVPLPPEIKLVSYFVPRDAWRIPVDSNQLQVCRVLYYFILFLPPGILLGLIAAASRVRLAILALLPPVILEAALMSIRGSRGFQPTNLMLGMAVSVAAAGLSTWLMHRWLRRQAVAA